MTQFDKLIARILARPPEAEFRDVRHLLEAYGWQLDRIRGSHVHFTKSGERTLSIPLVRGRRVKRRYLDLVINRLGLND